MRAAWCMAVFSIVVACDSDEKPDRVLCAGCVDGGRIDAAPVVCTASTSYTGVVAGSNTQFAGSDGSTAGSDFSTYWLGRMDPTSMPDFLQLTLYAGYGAYSSGTITEGMVQLTGDELAYGTCGACVFLFTDLHSVGSDVEVTDYYMPTGGTVNLTSVTGTLEGTITNLALQHMVISGQDLVPANDGCNATIPSITLNAMIEPQMPATGKPAPDGRMSFRFKLGNRTF